MKIDVGAKKREVQTLLTRLEQQEVTRDEGTLDKAVRQVGIQMARAQLSLWQEMCPYYRDGFVRYDVFKAAMQRQSQFLRELHLDFECNDVFVAAEHGEYVSVDWLREQILLMRSACEEMVSDCNLALAQFAFRNETGCSYLHLDAFEGNNEKVLICLRGGAHVNALNNDLETPLVFASFAGNLVTIGYLVGFGADTNIHTRGCRNTPLHVACGTINLNGAVVDRLLRAGADERALNARGETPLDLLMRVSSEKEEFGSVRLLLEKASVRRRWVRRWGWIVILRNRANAQGVGGGGSDHVGARVRPRRSSRLSEGRAAKALEFLMYRAPDGVFFKVMSFL